MEWVKELLTNYVEQPEKVDEFIEVFQKEFPKHAMPKAKWNEVNDELKLTKKQLEETTSSIETLKQKASTIEEYEAKLQTWEQQYQELEANTKAEIGKITKRSSLKELLLLNNAHQDAIDLLVEKYVDTTELSEDGKLANADDLLNKIKSEKKGLFVEQVVESADNGQHVSDKPKTDDADKLRKLFGL